MHVHATQVNPYAALDALRSAEKAEAKREAERVRQELMESAAEQAGESEISDDFVAQVQERAGSSRHPKRKNQRRQQNQSTREDSSEVDESDSHLSDWA